MIIDEKKIRDSVERRYELAEELRTDLNKRSAALAMCALDVPFWFNNFVWTYDPRLAEEGREGWVPFDLFPRQVELVYWLEDLLKNKREGCLSKSRDIGFTWVAGGFAVNKWLFVPGFKTGFGSRKEMYVDKIGDPDSIFAKMRTIMDRLPPWMMPDGFNKNEHDNYMRLINPENSNVISGEAGDQIGRGGRNTLYLVDEGAFLEHADNVNASLSANADCKVWASSLGAPGNLFDRKRKSAHIKQFRFHWRDDPRKDDEWAKKKQKELEDSPGTWECEYEIDNSSGVVNTTIPATWVAASRRLYDLIKAGEIKYDPPAEGRAGFDVGGGRAKSVVIPTYGIMVEQPTDWQETDNIHVTYAVLDICLENNSTTLLYDAPGVGNTVTSTLNHLPEKYEHLKVFAVNTGVPPEFCIMPDKREAKEWFVNLKAQIWWRGRDRFRATYEFMLFIDGDPKGVPHDIHSLIALCDCSELETQLSVPLWFKNEKGLIIMESKKQLATRGVASPDFAEALLLKFAEPDGGFAFGSVG